MTKKKHHSKKKYSKLAKTASRRVKWQKRLPTLIVLAVITAAAIYYFGYNKTSTGKRDGGSVQGYTAISFKKQGELSFTKADGTFISKIDIELAEDEEKRANGMMYRNKMEENQGMLFIFPREERQSFWMMNTVLSLDMLFVNSQNVVVNIHKDAVPFDKSSYASTGPAQYVVEVNAGYCDKYGIEPGDKIVWRRL
ncbi:DUF192 domain-containing protein [Bacteroidota bacterium]